MPTSEARFRCSAGADKVLALLQDLTFLSSAVPGVEKVERVDDRTALWTVRMKVGPFQRVSVYRGEVLTATSEEVEFRATGAEATVNGHIQVQPAGSDASDVTVRIAADGSGSLKPIVDSVLAKRLPNDVADFAKRVNAAFLGASSGS